jgi:myo-inositol-1(or 4)-monophosphatase
MGGGVHLSMCSAIKRVALEAASILRELEGKDEYLEVFGVNPLGDLTRKIDLVVEDHIYESIKSLGLNALFVGEERGVRESKPYYEYVVLVDPLDGSLNYAARIPFASVSIAVYKRGSSISSPIYGVVKNIYTDEIYELCNGNIYWNGKLVSSLAPRVENVFSIYTESPEMLRAVVEVGDMLVKSIKVRTMGAASLEAIYAAHGRIAGFYHLTGKLRNSDVAVAIGIANRLKAHIYSKPPLRSIRIDRVETIEKIVITRSAEVLDRSRVILGG